jgi:UDP-2,4-diacetamido-2,4,6-trideoxy-beta-L-altropyranose hydrolase
MRCLALSRRLIRCGVDVTFLSRELPGHRFAAIEEAGCTLRRLPAAQADSREDAEACLQLLAGRPLDWIIVDHYSLDATWERALRRVARAVFVIDDVADRDHDCDLLLDQNMFRDAEARYRGRVPPGCVTLLGPRYALLREEFAAARTRLRPRDGTVRRVLVSFGGTDPTDLSSKALRALRYIDPAPGVDVVIGASHPSRAQIERECAERGYDCHVDSTRMAELLARADFAIGAGGVSTWERCCLGVPALAICVASNQAEVIRVAAELGLLDEAPASMPDEVLGDRLRALWSRPVELAQMSQRCLAAVDGLGVARVSRALGFGSVVMRRAAVADSPQVFAWRNHESVRAVSYNQAPISAADHGRWFEGVLADPNRALLIGAQEGGDIGVVRFDIAADGAEVSIYLVPGLAGRGLGAELLCSAESWLRRERPEIRRLDARVLNHNAVSQRLFEAAGYQKGVDLFTKRFH